MLKISAFVLLMVSFSSLASQTPTGIELNSPWKVSLNQFAVKNIVHQSWGYSHAERNYHNTLKIAQAEGVEADEDILLAVSFLHDVGGLPGFEVSGVDHGVRSAEVAIPLLKSWGFPQEKLEKVRTMILEHIYYGPKPIDPLSQAFRDADMLDFLGVMGVSRLLAATSELASYPNIKNAILTYEKMEQKLPLEFCHASALVEGEKRIKESKKFLQSLKKSSFGGLAY
jgi:uncharacterized protein